MPRLYREAPVNSIWEGSGNVMGLDVLRAIGREPEVIAALMAELEKGRGSDDYLDRAIDELACELREPENIEAGMRTIAEMMALTLQGFCLSGMHPWQWRRRSAGRDWVRIIVVLLAPCRGTVTSRP